MQEAKTITKNNYTFSLKYNKNDILYKISPISLYYLHIFILISNQQNITVINQKI